MNGDNEAALLASVRDERPLLSFDDLNHARARALGEAVARIALEETLPICVRVTRGEQTAFHAAFDGTTAEHDDWVRRKINTAIRHEIPSLELVLRQRVSGRVPDWLDPHRFAVAGGAVPLFVGSVVAGTIAVSGLVDAIDADHAVAMRAIRAVRAGTE